VKVVGHYDPWAAGLAPTAGPTNLLVHFAGEGWPEAAKALETALAANRKREAAVIVVGVVAADSLTEAAGAGLEADASLLVTDDPSGGWAAAFGDPKAPATVLVGSAGQIRWKGEGPLDPAKLGKVLDKELEPGGSVAWRPLGSTAAPGAAAPDAPVRIAEGSEVPLRRLRGGSVVLCFWSSCSEPSIKQLRELREAISSAGEPLPTVLGIGDGEGASQVAEVAKRERLPFALIPDPERSIANRYGISSWPATVQVNPQGMIVATDLGLVPGISPCVQISRPVEKA
jgi:peroxiredoxin